MMDTRSKLNLYFKNMLSFQIGTEMIGPSAGTRIIFCLVESVSYFYSPDKLFVVFVDKACGF